MDSVTSTDVARTQDGKAVADSPGLLEDSLDTQHQPVCGTIEGGQHLHGVAGAIVLKYEVGEGAPDIDGKSNSHWSGSKRVKYSVMSSF
ncbi:MAG: hypothetical protein VX075_14380 [Pseudomonadota bacterium]|nr:hypothetical protein [Pseudomonadota bacterium]